MKPQLEQYEAEQKAFTVNKHKGLSEKRKITHTYTHT
jgi:hypothetical protein